ncbi:MAG TPA: uridine diphosphate-N-acetylglucosamine-binding protein YvcK [Anaerolineae bacterium]|nr:uridine diphosphate-N-acetylglucosamine-binding protein YvcK [Anaerolineae bacterium]
MKRWILVILIGTTLISLGFAVIIIDIYRGSYDNKLFDIFAVISLSSLPRIWRALIFGGSGLILMLIGLLGMNRSMLRPFVKPGKPLFETVSSYRKMERGPRIVAIGGGTGLSTLLRGLKRHTHNITALVTVADDGGSSGELRLNLGILPPGDIRNCLAALSDDEELITQVFQYRFGKRAKMNGHSLGNLFISALVDITGSFEEAVVESGRVLAVRGRVIPSTLHDVKLVAEIQLPNRETAVKVMGESQISKTDGVIQKLWIQPSNPLPFPPAIQAILMADLIIIGPGSLYTSILPNLLVPGLADAIRSSKALKFYICNVANERGETDGYSNVDHVKVVEKHLRDLHFDVIICNNKFSVNLPKGVEWVLSNPQLEEQYSVYYAPLADEDNPWRHDAELLAEAVIDLYLERTGPLNKNT